MILVTVGMQLAFDRLISAMDEIAPQLDEPVIAQSGRGSYRAKNLDQRISIPPDAFEKLVADASVVVSHAGIGTVLTAQRAGTPVILVPRRASLGEHRNDHQLATAKQLGDRPNICVVADEKDLGPALAQALANRPSGNPAILPDAGQLTAAINHFIRHGELP